MDKKQHKLLFLIIQILGYVFVLTGIIMVVKVSEMSVSITNLQPVLKFATSLVFIIVGFVVIGLSYSIRWKRMVLNTLKKIESHLNKEDNF